MRIDLSLPTLLIRAWGPATRESRRRSVTDSLPTIDRSIPGATSFRIACASPPSAAAMPGWQLDARRSINLGSTAAFWVRKTGQRGREACRSRVSRIETIPARAPNPIVRTGALQALGWISGSWQSSGGSSPGRSGSWKTVLIKWRAERTSLLGKGSSRAVPGLASAGSMGPGAQDSVSRRPGASGHQGSRGSRRSGPPPCR